MAVVYDIEAGMLIETSAKELAKLDSIKSPEWSTFVKTGRAKERVPVRDDWWYIRAAAILRTIYRSHGPIGVQKLRVKYGSKKNRGHKPELFYKASGKIIRVILQQLEKEGLIKKAEVGFHKGRVITAKGRSFLDKLASSLAAKRPVRKIEALSIMESDEDIKNIDDIDAIASSIQKNAEGKKEDVQHGAMKQHDIKKPKKEKKPVSKEKDKKEDDASEKSVQLKDVQEKTSEEEVKAE